jgi:hypothetical protein
MPTQGINVGVLEGHKGNTVDVDDSVGVPPPLQVLPGNERVSSIYELKVDVLRKLG